MLYSMYCTLMEQGEIWHLEFSWFLLLFVCLCDVFFPGVTAKVLDISRQVGRVSSRAPQLLQVSDSVTILYQMDAYKEQGSVMMNTVKQIA